MIKNVHIKGFKCFNDEKIDFSNLTVITGPNSSGKSSLIQAILINLNHTNLPDQEVKSYLDSLGGFVDLKNKKTNPDKFSIDIEVSNNPIMKYYKSLDGISESHIYGGLSLPIAHHYLSANRKSIEETNIGQNPIEGAHCGIYAQYIANYYYFNKDSEIDIDLRYHKASANTLEAQVNYWLSYICDTELLLNIDKITTTLYRAYYKIDNQEYKPQNLGAGVGYLIAILTKALLISKEVDEAFIIENPEIHLHPKSQARLAEFFAFVANTGRQIIIETHSEHLISKLRYCVYKNQIQSSQVIIQYRQPDKFEKIEILPSGRLLNELGDHSFPRGFFDATLDNIFEINSNV